MTTSTSRNAAAAVEIETRNNKTLTRRWFDEVWNQRREATIDELFAIDAVAHGLGEPMTGPAGFKAFFHTMHGAFPDLRLELHELLGDGDLTALRLTMYGTHRGDHLGFKATNQPVIAHGIILMRWRNGQIVEGWNEFDSAGAIRALQNA